MGSLTDFFLQPSIWVYLFVFFGKIIEVSVSTIRIVLINRGERLIGSITAFFEVALWLLVTGTVLAGLLDNPDIIRIIVFALAFTCGNYFGSWLEGKLGFGLCSIHVIISEEGVADGLANELRKCEFAVTIMEGEGKDGKRNILLLHLKRKRIPRALSIIKSKLKSAVITVNDVKLVNGGFIKK